MDRVSYRTESAGVPEVAAFAPHSRATKLPRSLELLIHSYVEAALLTCRRDRQGFLSEFARFRPSLEPLLDAADIAIDAFETIESMAPRKRHAAWRRLPMRENYKLRARFTRGSRLFAEFMRDVLRMRARARERIKEGGRAAIVGREFVAWAKPILRYPAVAARVFDDGARRLLTELSKQGQAADSADSPGRQAGRN